MSAFIQDRNGRHWRRDNVESFKIVHAKGDRDVVVARIFAPVSREDFEVEFNWRDWDEGKTPTFIPAAPGHSAVFTSVHADGSIHHQIAPVLAWQQTENNGLWPLTFLLGYGQDDICAVIHPCGRVADHEYVWPSVEEYLAEREKMLREEAGLLGPTVEDAAA